VSCGGRAVEVSCGKRGETARAVEHAWRTLEIWERGKGRVTVCRGGETESVYFFHSLSNSLTRSVFTELTEFDRVWSSLTIFEFLTRFYTLYVSWLVKSYDFTSQLAILTTMVEGLDFSFYLKNNIN